MINKKKYLPMSLSLIQKENKIIFLTPLADIYSCFKHVISWFMMMLS